MSKPSQDELELSSSIKHKHSTAAPLWRRLAAMFYEAWLIIALWFLVAAILLVIKNLFFAEQLVQGKPALDGLWLHALFIGMIMTIYAFYCYFWINNGQTLPMQTWRVKVRNAHGENISYQQGFIRITVAMLSLGCLGLGYLWVLIDKEKRSWHDIASNTHLSLEPKRIKAH